LVLSGGVFLRTCGSDEPQRMRAGESALHFYGDSHRIWDAAGGLPTVVDISNQHTALEVPPTIRVGDAPIRAVVLSSALELVYISPSAFASRAAPVCRVMNAKNSMGEPMGALAIDVRQVRRACQGAGATAFASTLAGLLLIHMLRDIYQEFWHDRDIEVRAPNARRVAAALRKIHAHLDRAWTLPDLAKEVGLSRSTFAEAFRTYVGVAPATYLMEARMKRATQLLATGSIALHEIARRVGYRLESSFARAFKQHYGLSPKHFIGRERSF
jgi:AraC-like DNA-binding protein